MPAALQTSATACRPRSAASKTSSSIIILSSAGTPARHYHGPGHAAATAPSTRSGERPALCTPTPPISQPGRGRAPLLYASRIMHGHGGAVISPLLGDAVGQPVTDPTHGLD